MVTAELAVLLPALVLLLVVALRALSAGVAELQCVDAARAGARAAARGEASEVVRRVVLAVAPNGAQVAVVVDAGRVRVQVAASIELLPWTRIPLRAVAEAASRSAGSLCWWAWPRWPSRSPATGPSPPPTWLRSRGPRRSGPSRSGWCARRSLGWWRPTARPSRPAPYSMGQWSLSPRPGRQWLTCCSRGHRLSGRRHGPVGNRRRLRDVLAGIGLGRYRAGSVSAEPGTKWM